MNEDILTETNYNQPQRPSHRWFKLAFLFCVLLLVAGYFTFDYLQEAPSDFRTNTPYTVELGTSTKAVAEEAKQLGFVKSKWLLYAVLRAKYSEEGIKASTYNFKEPLDVFAFAKKLTEGDATTNLLAFTVIEGESSKQIATKAALLLPDFSAEEFLLLAKNSEGRLFPETYFVPPNFTASDLYKLLTSTFLDITASLQDEISQSELTLDEIVILASIIEREANDEESMKMVSGILQERLRLGMALQVDASMEYVINKPLKELTAADLKTDSPYNTYLYAGLPPTPIGNPGRLSIEAVLNPTPSEYMFYITGDDGEFYYAKTFDGHRTNIARHLR